MYTKIFRQILESTLVEDYVTRHIFIDLLILADQDGCIDMTPQVISRTLNVPIDVVQGAIDKLSEPDPHSRSHAEEGRRLVMIDPDRTWGWRIVNYLKYRRTVDDETRRTNNKVRKQRQRDRERETVSAGQPESQPVTLRHTMSHDVTPVTPVTFRHAMSRQAEAEEEAEAYIQAEADEGGAGGKAPASEGQRSANQDRDVPGTDGFAFSFFTRDKDKSKDKDYPAPLSQTPAPTPVEASAPAYRTTPAPTSHRTAAPPQSAPETARGRITMPEPVHASAARSTVIVEAPDPEEPWDALDFAMTNREPFGDVEWKVLRRAVFYHWRVSPRPYWSTPAARVDSPERLAKVLPMMIEQMPADFTVSGGATLPIHTADPECKLCDGCGYTIGPNEAYEGELKFLQANPCACVKTDERPWRRWKPSKEE
jgi:hypothetical protein